MSRSRRHNPIIGMTTAKSEKKDKRLANRKLRRITKSLLQSNPETEVYPDLNDVSSVWCFDKDGKQRFDPEEYPKLMRK